MDIRCYFCLIILFLVSSNLLTGCQTEQEPVIKTDALADARLMPETFEIITSGTSSIINIISSAVMADFPDSLTFSLEAESNYIIDNVQFLYTTHRILRPSVTVSVKPDFDPGHRVSTDWQWDTRKASLPPGAEIEYQWKITNDAADTLETEIYRLEFEDTNHNWKQQESEKIRLFWYEGDDDFGNELMEAARQALVTLSQDTESELVTQVDIYIYRSTDELHDALIFPVEWTGGLAFTDHGVITLGIKPGNTEWGRRAIKHELSHMVIHQVTYSPLSYVPSWLDEGLAMYSEGELLENFELQMQKAISNDALLPIKTISGSFPTVTEDAELAYAQSFSIVDFLISNYGSEKMQDLLQAFSTGTGLDDALIWVYGFDSQKLETHWQDSVR